MALRLRELVFNTLFFLLQAIFASNFYLLLTYFQVYDWTSASGKSGKSGSGGGDWGGDGIWSSGSGKSGKSGSGSYVS
jgi:hypothetical protein